MLFDFSATADVLHQALRFIEISAGAHVETDAVFQNWYQVISQNCNDPWWTLKVPYSTTRLKTVWLKPMGEVKSVLV